MGSTLINGRNIGRYSIAALLMRTIHSFFVPIICRESLKEYFAEFFGVMFIVFFGSGVGCQVVLTGNPGIASSPKGVSL